MSIRARHRQSAVAATMAVVLILLSACDNVRPTGPVAMPTSLVLIIPVTTGPVRVGSFQYVGTSTATSTGALVEFMITNVGAGRDSLLRSCVPDIRLYAKARADSAAFSFMRSYGACIEPFAWVFGAGQQERTSQLLSGDLVLPMLHLPGRYRLVAELPFAWPRVEVDLGEVELR